MKNFEKWEKEILQIISRRGDTFAVINDVPVICDRKYCSCENIHKECMLFPSYDKPFNTCSVGRIAWLYSEYVEKPKLNKYERALCEALQKGWIFRNKNGRLAFSIEKVNDRVRNVNFDIFTMMKSYNSKIYFGFIKDGFNNQWSIEELLKLEV